jgi:hypothetical protein
MWIEINLHSCVKCGFYWADFDGIHNDRVKSCGQLLQRVLARSFFVNYDCRWADCHKPTFTGQIFVNDSSTELQEIGKHVGSWY